MTLTGSDAEPLAETRDISGAYPRLAEAQVAQLSRYGERRETQAEEVLVREGDRERDFYVILAGKVAVIQGYGAATGGAQAPRLISVHGPRRFLDELSLLTRQPAFVSSVVVEPGAVLAVPVDRLAEAAARDPGLADTIVRAFMSRREMLIGLGAGFLIIGSRYSPDARRLREFAARNRLPHRWIDLEEDRDAERLLQQLGVSPEETPVVIWRSETVLRNPSNADLATVLGLPLRKAPEGISDLVVVGAGPAGLAAAVYGASEGLSTLVFDSVATGGQAGTSSKIENYLGFPAGISGAELAERGVIQAERFGADFSIPSEAVGLAQESGHFVVRLDDGSEVPARTVVIATGSRYRKLPVVHLEEFEGKSIYYAATSIEAHDCEQRPIAIVGGGNSAGQATVYLAEHASRIRLVVRERDLAENMSRYLIDRIAHTSNVELLLRTEVRELMGTDGCLEHLVVEDVGTGERRVIDAAQLFVFIGAAPCTGWLAGTVDLDDHGYVRTGPGARTGANLLETSLPGVLAVGDVRSGSIKRVASAVGEGSMAVRLVHEHLARVGAAGQ